MAYGDGFAKLNPESDTLSPLPHDYRNGLIAVATLGMLSFVTTSTLFLYLTSKFIKWHLKRPRYDFEEHHAQELNPALSERHYAQAKTQSSRPTSGIQPRQAPANARTLNQFLILIYNLLFADMHQATAFLLNATWVGWDGIMVRSPTCWAQGWFVSVGDLASSVFISSIAVHTYLAVVKNWKPSQWVLYMVIGCNWLFIYALAIIGVIITNNGKDAGGFYVRAVAWCWINHSYEKSRLTLHYAYIFVSLAMTNIIYSLIFAHLRRESCASRSYANMHVFRPVPDLRNAASSGNRSTHHPAFLIYPVIYVACTAPLALGRIVSMTGRTVPVAYFCFAGAMIASTGWLDVILFSVTRHSIIFSADPNMEELGLDTFAFMRTPHGREFGNMIWIQGPPRGTNVVDEDIEHGRKQHGWWRLGSTRSGTQQGTVWHGRNQRTTSQESLRRDGTDDTSNVIQMDTVTTVIVEIGPMTVAATGSVNSLQGGLDKVVRNVGQF